MDEELKERVLGTERIYDGRIIKVRVDRVAMPNGHEAKREVVEHPGAVAIAALTEAGEILLVRQYRRAPDRILREIPAGKLEPRETPLECAQRELAEETGLAAAEWTKLGAFFTSPGFADEFIHLFLARELSPAVGEMDEDEAIEVSRIPLAEAMEAVSRGEFADAKTIIGICLAARMSIHE